MKQKIRATVIAWIFLVSVSGCMLFGEAPPADEEYRLMKSDTGRIDPGTVPTADILLTAEANNAFAADLYRALADTGENIIFSPYSVFTALAMTYAGAETETAAEMEDVLHMPFSGDRFHSALNALDLNLVETPDGDPGEGEFIFSSLNSLWGQDGMEFRSSFLDSLAAYYDTGLYLLDFVSSPEPGRRIINDWTADATEEIITDLLPPGSVTAETRLVLVNALYFKAAWENQFLPELTGKRPFRLLSGGEPLVDMMQVTDTFGYGSGEGWTAVELPYAGGEWVMDLIIPEHFALFEESMTASTFRTVLEAVSYTEVALAMPKFSFTWEESLVDLLCALGMPTAFSDAADFSGLYAGSNLALSEVRHKAFIEVDEEGTEAAAATAAVISLTSMPLQPKVVTVDTPFIFLIRNPATDTILFAGRVMNP